MQTALKQRDWTRAALTAALALLAAVSTVAAARSLALADAENTLSAIYHKSFYETCELTESMAVNLNKLSVARGSVREALIGDIIRQAQGAQANLAVLPLGGGTAPALKFANQVGDFCDTLLAKRSASEPLTEDDRSTVARLSQTAAELCVGLNALLEQYESGTENLTAAFEGEEGFAITDPAVEYPTLLYDGPFSDGATGSDFKALYDLKRVSQAEAESLLREFVGAEAVTGIESEGESESPTPCYEFSVSAGGYEMSAAVTKTGGKVLYLLCHSAVSDDTLSETECFRRAEAFLLSRGFGSMELSYYSRHDGILTVNYAAVQNGVILYPDLIKVQISMADGRVVGMEAGSYLRNHTERVLEKPYLSAEDAAALVGGSLNAESARLCVIPTNGGERYCYEVSASGEGSTYLLYLDAMTGAEVEIMQVVGDSDATLVM